MNKEGCLLGLDASSSKIGYCIWDKKEDKIIKLGFYVLKNRESILTIADEFEKFIEEIKQEFSLNEMVIEEAFQALFGGRSSSHTTTLLNQVNALYQYICYKKGLKVNTITVHKARKFALQGKKLLTKQKSGKSQKEQVFDMVVGIELDKSLFPIKEITKGTRKGEMVYEDGASDMVDAYIVTKGYILSQKANV
jgi:Holliday junction resolvasome RuvABC endonuclease subunit